MLATAFAVARRIPVKAWATVGVLALFLILWGAFKYQQARADRAEANLAPAVAIGEALDKVATDTPVIRQDQKDKQDAVDQITGSDDRLPDCYGRDLQRVRDGRSGNDPR